MRCHIFLPTSVKQLTVIQPTPQDSAGSELQSPHLASTPPPPGANVRRHQSLTAGATRKLNSGLRRSGTLHTPMPPHHQSQTSPEVQPSEEEYTTETIEQDECYNQNQNHPTNSVGCQSPWGAGSNSNQNTEWRNNAGPAQVSSQKLAIDDVQRALSTLEIARASGVHPTIQYGGVGAGTGQSLHPPRFNPKHPPPLQPPGAPRLQQNNDPQLMSEFEGRKTPLATSTSRSGSGSTYYQNSKRSGQSDERAWEGREPALSAGGSNSHLHHGDHNKNSSPSSLGGGVGNGNETIPNVPPTPWQYIQQPQRMSNSQNSNQTVPDVQQLLTTSIDVPTLIATKGYNPPTFDNKPAFARFFVIKSYTEDDVHKSLKYEIWSSTDPGNKRLDKAFKETAGRGPIYLFFSVNAR